MLVITWLLWKHTERLTSENQTGASKFRTVNLCVYERLSHQKCVLVSILSVWITMLIEQTKRLFDRSWTVPDILSFMHVCVSEHTKRHVLYVTRSALVFPVVVRKSALSHVTSHLQSVPGRPLRSTRWATVTTFSRRALWLSERQVEKKAGTLGCVSPFTIKHDGRKTFYLRGPWD